MRRAAFHRDKSHRLKNMLQVDESVTIDQVRKAARNAISSTAEDVTRTIADQLRQEGRQEGKQEGRQEGGLDLLRRQLEARFGTIPPRYQERLQSADSETLLRWSERILTAQTIDEVFSQ